MYDITSRESFNSLPHWINDIKNWAPDADVVLLGNKSDKSGSRQVSIDEANSFAKDANIKYFETSALNGSNIADAFNSLLTGIFIIYILLNSQSINILFFFFFIAIYKRYKAIGGPEYAFDTTRIPLGELGEDDAPPAGCNC